MQALPRSIKREILTPTLTQSVFELRWRRRFVGVLNVLTYMLIVYAFAKLAMKGGWTVIDGLMMLCVLVATPWTVLGFWNSLIGLWLLHSGGDARSTVVPLANSGDGPEPITTRVAVLMTLRNEDPRRAFDRLRAVKASVDATPYAAQFGYFLLSDSDRLEIAAEELRLFNNWRDREPVGVTLVYRRRHQNTGYKAGNLRDFCENLAGDYEIMLPLDADSLMDGETIVRMTRIMQFNPRLGILQSLVVGMPSKSAFARIFQFGMRHGMRAYTMGASWWTGECGPFWGHNAMVRIAPFHAHCELPVLPGAPPLGGHILSHDQVEATLMRRAGYEVRVLPEECGSWEENPPTILVFTQRDLRWCQGNLQYLKLLDLPGLRSVSRFQLVWAILMFIGIPAWTLLIALAALKSFDGEPPDLYPSGPALRLYLMFLLMSLTPKLCGLVDILLTPGGAARYGGRLRFLAGAGIEIVFSFLLGAVSTFRTTLFMLGLPFGKAVIWSGQQRDAHGISWATACGGLWPQLLFGIVVIGAMAAASIKLALWSLPLTAGFILAIPFAVWTADPASGLWLERHKLTAIPEEFDTPAVIRRVQGGEGADGS